MEKEDSEKRWKETLSSAAAKTALPLTSLLASGAYATQEALKGANQHVKNLAHTIKIHDLTQCTRYQFFLTRTLCSTSER
jgi:hypothetical protein